jgi:hypothetical protein
MKKVKYLNRRGLSPAQHKAAVEQLKEMTDAWISVLWQAMHKTGKGYPRQKTTGHTGKGTDRRGDKLAGTNTPKVLRGVAVRGLVAGHVPSRPHRAVKRSEPSSYYDPSSAIVEEAQA